MAKQLLGKEVTAALNERIKANVAACQEKGVNPTLCIIRVGENPSDISYEKGATKRTIFLQLLMQDFASIRKQESRNHGKTVIR